MVNSRTHFLRPKATIKARLLSLNGDREEDMGTLMTVFQETWAPLVTPFSIVTVTGHMQKPWPEVANT